MKERERGRLRDGGKEGCGMAAKWAMRWGCTTGRRGGYVQTRARVQEGSKQTLKTCLWRVFTKMPQNLKKKTHKIICI